MHMLSMMTDVWLVQYIAHHELESVIIIIIIIIIMV